MDFALKLYFYCRKHLDPIDEPRPTVHISGVSPSTLETLLKFLHSGSVTINDDEEAKEFISAANFFRVKGFQEEGAQPTQVLQTS